MPAPTVVSAVLQDDGRYLVTLSDGATFYSQWFSETTIASSALPTGAATSARQAAPGTAGSPSTDVTSTIGVDVPVTGTLTSASGGGSTVQIAMQGMASAAFVTAGTWVGTVLPEASIDGGTTWVPCYVYNLNQAHPQVLASLVLASGQGLFQGNDTFSFLPVPGASHYRLRCSAYTSGTVNVAMRAVAASALPQSYRHLVLDASSAFSTLTTASTFLLIDNLDWASEGAVYVASNGSFQLYAYPLDDSSHDARDTTYGRTELTAGSTFSGGNTHYRRYSLSSLMPFKAVTLELNNLAGGTSVSHWSYQFRG